MNPVLTGPLSPELPHRMDAYVHLNRVIKKYDLDVFYIAGPGHGGPALVGNTYLEGTYSEIYPDNGQDMPEIVNWTWGDPK
jgi:phosphoketolase